MKQNFSRGVVDKFPSSTVMLWRFYNVHRYSLLFSAIVESDDLGAVLNEMDKAFNYSQKVSNVPISFYTFLLRV